MRGGRSALAGLALAVISVGTFTSARASQLWNEQGAHSSMDRARTRVEAALSRAERDGLTRAQLASLRSRESALAAGRPPGASILWDTSSLPWYRAETKGYLRLAARVAETERVVTSAARARAERGLSRSRLDISSAHAYRVDTAAFQTVLLREEKSVLSGRTARDFLAVARAISAARHPFHLRVQTRRLQVHSILVHDGNSLARIQADASAQVSGASAKLSLLSLLDRRARGLSAALNAAAAREAADRTPVQAALTDLDIGSILQQVDASWKTTMPDKMVVISTEDQSATMYQNGAVVYSAPVTTGGPELPTDHGVFHMYMKASPFVFHSPFPLGSPYYYPPTPVQFWMPFDGQEGLHDASWRSNFGPGSNMQPTDLGTGTYILGTHGCVNLPADAAAWLWNWAPIGTTVVVI